MSKDKKYEIVKELTQKIAQTPYFYITDASGMDVASTNQFRRECFNKGIEYKVVKNSLIKKALEANSIDYSSFKSSLKGFSGILFSSTGKLPAELILEFRKKNPKLEKPLLKVALIDSTPFVGDKELETLKKLKSKNELIGEVISILQSPAKNVVSALKSSGAKLAGILKTLSEKEN
ncbi:MAG: 50S ribosomal protein L10 [Cytophagales bacterium]|nr:50S ribosomal protein L10 [Cytophagales bacterium]MDW8383736.1 50S ribosomal protein L10 [Flammeovirgaceae bacterium]